MTLKQLRLDFNPFPKLAFHKASHQISVADVALPDVSHPCSPSLPIWRGPSLVTTSSDWCSSCYYHIFTTHCCFEPVLVKNRPKYLYMDWFWCRCTLITFKLVQWKIGWYRFGSSKKTWNRNQSKACLYFYFIKVKWHLKKKGILIREADRPSLWAFWWVQKGIETLKGKQALLLHTEVNCDHWQRGNGTFVIVEYANKLSLWWYKRPGGRKPDSVGVKRPDPSILEIVTNKEVYLCTVVGS